MRENEVQIWRARLDVDAAVLDRLAGSLAPDERERAARFHFDDDRRRFIAARGFLRALLGPLVGLPPARLVFDYSPKGKPRLAPVCQTKENLRFNLSHSGPLALFALAFGREVGIDLEQIRELRDMEDIGRRIFSPSEQEELRAAGAGKTALFFRLWTRHEALGKCVGEGVTGDLETRCGSGTVLELTPETGYVGAVAVERGPLELAAFTSSSRAPDDPTPQRIH